MPSPPTNSDIDAAMTGGAKGNPETTLVTAVLKALSAAISGITNTVAWGSITGTLSTQSDLQAALNGKAAFSHTHTLAAITDAKSAAGKDVPATGNASSGQVVLGSDTRLSDARTPLPHPHVIGDVTGLATALTTAKLDWLNIPIIAPAVGTYVLEEYAPCAMTISYMVERMGSGTMAYTIQVNGTTVVWNAPLSAPGTQATRTGVSNLSVPLGAKTTLVVTSTSGAANFSGTLVRART